MTDQHYNIVYSITELGKLRQTTSTDVQNTTINLNLLSPSSNSPRLVNMQTEYNRMDVALVSRTFILVLV